MAIDREKVLSNAQKFVEKKKYDKAVLEYQKIIQEDPNDARTLLKVGDLQSKMEAYAEAIATYERVGKFYATQGFALKAIAVFKQIREIIAKHVPQLEERYAHIPPRLAELYQQLGLVSDALATLDEVATRLQRGGREKEAIDVFLRVVELDPSNPLPHLRLAEAYSRMKDVEAAVSEFGIAGSTLVKLGRRDDALKVLERLLHHKPDPAHARVAAELYLARGQQNDGMLALAKLQVCFQANPQDLDTLELLAKAFNAIGQGAKALEVQKEMARIARAQQRMDLFRPLVEKLLRLAPHDEVVLQLAGLAPQPGQAAPQAAPPPPPPPPPPPQQQARHSGYEQPAPQQQRQAPPQRHAPEQQYGRPDPHPEQQPYGRPDPRLQQQQYGRPDPRLQQQQYARGYEEPQRGAPQGRRPPQQSEDLYEEVGTGDIELGREAAFDLGRQPEPAYGGGRGRPEPPRHRVDSQGSEVFVDEAAIEVVDEQADPAQSADVRAQLARILADATSFRRARLYSRAVETLRIGLEIHPRSIEVRECLRDALLEAGRHEEAVEEMLLLAGIQIDQLDADAAARALQDVLSVDPTNARAVQMLRELGYEIVDEGQEQAPAEDDYVPAVLGAGNPHQYDDRDAYDPHAPLPAYELDEAPQQHLQQVDDPFEQGEQSPLPAYPLEAAAESAASFDLVDRERERRREREQQHERGRHASEATDTFNAPAHVRPPSRRPAAGPELEEALEEAEFFASRGLFDDARSILTEQLERLPDHPLLCERMVELEAQERSAKAESGAREVPHGPASGHAQRAQEQEDRSFDIAATLDAIEGLDGPTAEAAPYMNTEQQIDVEEVFAKFKEGVAKQISVDDAQAHYDLGVAYKEMALLDDAIREFETSARDPKRECVCQSMIGLIQIERGNLNEAIDAFMRGLHAPQRLPDQETVLAFEIGACYEAKKMTKEALNFYQRSARNNPQYRDVSERIRRLNRPDGKLMPARAAAGGDDEFDRAFDDIIGGRKA